MTTVTVGIIVKNEAGNIRRLLDSILEQNVYDLKFEIIVVDGNSTDGTKEVLFEFYKNHAPLLRVYFFDKGNHGLQRNEVVNHANGRYIAFIDAGAVAGKQWLCELVADFEKAGKKYPKLAGIGGFTRFVEDTTAKRIIYPLLQTPFGTGGSRQLGGKGRFELVDSFPNCNAIYEAAVLRENPYLNMAGGEDFELNLRLGEKGYLLGMTGRAEVSHDFILGWHDLIRKLSGYGTMQIRSYKTGKKMRWYAKLVALYGTGHIAGLFCLAAGVNPISRLFVAGLALQTAFFTVLGLGYFMKSGRPCYMLMPVFYPLQYLVYFWGLAKGAAQGGAP